MRITFRTVNRHMQDTINNRYNDLAKLQEQLSTGKRIMRPSDDPVDVANDLKMRSKSSELVQFRKNIEDGLSFIGVSDTAMESMNTLLQRLRELAVQGSTDTLSVKERFYLNKEVEQLTRQMLALINTRYKDDYIFSGTQTKVPPFVLQTSAASTVQDYSNLKMAYYNAAGLPAGSSVQLRNGFDNTAITNMIPGSFKLTVAGVAYTENVDYRIDYENGIITLINPALLVDATPGTANYGPAGMSMTFDYLTIGKDIYGNPISTTGEVLREIESGISMPINITADEMWTDTASGTTMLSTLIRFGQSLLQNDGPNIQNSITRLDTAFTMVLSAQSKNGARVNRFETTQGRNEEQANQVSELLGNLEDAEMADTVMRFNTVQSVYEAALKSAAQVIQPSLVNFL